MILNPNILSSVSKPLYNFFPATEEAKKVLEYVRTTIELEPLEMRMIYRKCKMSLTSGWGKEVSYAS